MAILFPTSKIQSKPTANHKAGLNGNRKRHMLPNTAPIRKKGFLRPHLGDHVLSEIAPIIGWMIRPVTGPAILRMGRISSEAPRKRKIGLIALCWSPKLYWIPRNPTFMLKICQKLSLGFGMDMFGGFEAGKSAW